VGTKSFEWFKVPANFNMTNQFRNFCRSLGKDAVTSAGVLVGVWAIAARELPDGDLGSCDPAWLAEQVGYNSPKASLKTAYGLAITRSLVACKYATEDLKLVYKPLIDPVKSTYKAATNDPIPTNNNDLQAPPARAERREEERESREEKKREEKTRGGLPSKENGAPKKLDDSPTYPPFSNFPEFTRGEVKRMAKELNLLPEEGFKLLQAVDAEMDAGTYTPPLSDVPEKIYENLKKLAVIMLKKQTTEKRRNAGPTGIRFE
jgi:hypothetical protein